MDGIFGDENVKSYVTNSVENDEINIRKFRKKNRKLLLIELLYEYAKNSTLHGLRYIVEKGLHLMERFFWFLTFCMSLAMCLFLISKVYIKWIESPVLVSFSEKFVTAEEVPFPSITICPELKTISSKYNYSDEMESYFAKDKSNFTIDRLRKLDHMDTVCGFMLYAKESETGRNITNRSLIDDIIEAAPSVDDLIFHCVWQGEQHWDCSDFFKPVVTKKGICFNFNSLAANEILRTENLHTNFSYLDATNPSTDWSETGVYTKSGKDSYPRRGRSNVDEPNLEIILLESPDDHDSWCNVLKSGYTIFVQNPMDLPQTSNYFYAALHGQMTSLALKFSVLRTADNLKKYSAETRQCYFPGDKYLRYFRIYTFDNCRLECQSNYTFEHCNCVWFHMPHTDSDHICTVVQRYCVRTALEIMSLENNTAACGCLPLCDSVQFDAEVLKTDFNMPSLVRIWEKKYNRSFNYIASQKFSSIEVYFKEPRFISMRRTELFGVTDFMANCGGLLGLFLGFSFLSLVEIFYFGTLRLYYRIKKQSRQDKKKINEEKKQ